MGRYEELRRFYRLPHQERAAMVRDEILVSLTATDGAIAALLGAGGERLQQVFGGHCEELIEIASDSARTIRQLADRIAPDGRDITSDELMRELRHDLRGPVGTLRNAALMVRRRLAVADDPLVAQVDAVVAAAHEMIDVIEALTEDDERE